MADLGELGSQRNEEQRNKRIATVKTPAEEGLRAAMSNENGRAFVWGLLERAGIYRSSHVPGQADGTAFNEGARNQGLALFADVMKLAPENYPRMAAEAQAREKAKEKQSG